MVDGDAGGLYRSDDGGANWKRASDDARIWQRGWYFGQITADPKNADRVYSMNTIVLRSDDGGTTFVPLKGDQTGDDFHALWIDPNDSNRQILGSDQGAQVTLNGGATWSSWHNQPTAQIYRVSTDNRFPYWVYGAQQDSGALSLPSRGPGYDGINMSQLHEITPGGESDNIAPDPKDHDIVFGGRVDKLDLRTQQVRHVDPTLAAEPDLYRATWTLPLVFSRRDPHILYFGNQRVFRTTDGGEHWDAISPDLTRENPGAPATLDASAAANNLGTGPRRGVVYAIARRRVATKTSGPAPHDTCGSLAHPSDEGAHWENITPKALDAVVERSASSMRRRSTPTARTAIDRHRLDDFAVYLSTMAAELAADRERHRRRQCRQCRARRSRCAAVCSTPAPESVYVSFDDGEHWQPLQNCRCASVRDLEVYEADLCHRHTHGRGSTCSDGRRRAAPGRRPGRRRGVAAWQRTDRCGSREPRHEFFRHAAAEG
jgi:hypothetical protein